MTKDKIAIAKSALKEEKYLICDSIHDCKFEIANYKSQLRYIQSELKSAEKELARHQKALSKNIKKSKSL